MTDKNTSDAGLNAEQGGGDLFNTAAGWVLFAAGLGLGLSILSGKYFHASDPERPEQLGYVIEGAASSEAEAPVEMTMAEALTLASAADGEKVYAKCKACHTVDAGGANGVGPNLHGIMGASKAGKGDFSYSSGLAAMGGNWGWDEMNLWLKNPKAYVEGTKMGFAGLGKIEDRAAVALYMNEQGSNLPLPEFTPADPAEETAEDAAVEGGEGEAEAAQNAGEEAAGQAEA